MLYAGGGPPATHANIAQDKTAASRTGEDYTLSNGAGRGPFFSGSGSFDIEKLVLNGVLNQRSQDVLAANNWNVCQYAVLMHMLAQVCDMQVGELVHVIADAHIYDRHVPLIRELISREPYPAPTFWLNPEVKDFYQLPEMM